MEEVLRLLAGTVSMRPYVFLFFAAYIFAAVPHLGWKRIAAFTIGGYLIAFTSEFLSVNTGFPYGWYYYIDKTSTNELWIAGVPFFDSISYVFLSYCSYSTAIFILSPLKSVDRSMVILETLSIRSSFPTLLLGSLLQTYLDIIIDPVALQGERWFLGRIYGYLEKGHHFGIPLSNYIGWFMVSFIMILLLQRIAVYGSNHTAPAVGVCYFPGSCLLPVLLYIAVIAFNLTIAFMINEMTIVITGFFISLLPLVIVLLMMSRRLDRYNRNELAEHLRDFPWSPAGKQLN
jgi:putative membrane protein